MNFPQDTTFLRVSELHKRIFFDSRFSKIREKIFLSVSMGMYEKEDDPMLTLFRAFRFSEKIHENDVRKDHTPYITHPIRLVESMLESYPEEAYISDGIVLILHDTIEDHPECWRELLSSFGLKIFRDVLILSRVSSSVRKEMLRFFIGSTNLDDPIVDDILHILSPVDPLVKLRKFSRYSEDLLGQESQRVRAAILLYEREIIQRIGWKKGEDEYIGLGNYLYFRRKDMIRKVQDMLDNMSDMQEMEDRQPGYIEKRRIKAYILGVKLRNSQLTDEFSHLQQAFQDVGMQMYSDSEVLVQFQQISGIIECGYQS